MICLRHCMSAKLLPKDTSALLSSIGLCQSWCECSVACILGLCKTSSGIQFDYLVSLYRQRHHCHWISPTPFTKRLPGFKQLCYRDRLQRLNIPILNSGASTLILYGAIKLCLMWLTLNSANILNGTHVVALEDTNINCIKINNKYAC